VQCQGSFDKHFIDARGKYILNTWDNCKWYDPRQDAHFYPSPCSYCQPDEYKVYREELEKRWDERYRTEEEEEQRD
jgi:hypothetical protein